MAAISQMWGKRDGNQWNTYHGAAKTRSFENLEVLGFDP